MVCLIYLEFMYFFFLDVPPIGENFVTPKRTVPLWYNCTYPGLRHHPRRKNLGIFTPGFVPGIPYACLCVVWAGDAPALRTVLASYAPRSLTLRAWH